MIIPMELGKDSYDIILERGCLRRAGDLLNLRRKVLIVTDDGVPASYAQTVAAQSREAEILTLPLKAIMPADRRSHHTSLQATSPRLRLPVWLLRRSTVLSTTIC